MSARHLLFVVALGTTTLSAQEGQALRLDDDTHGIHDNDLLSPEFHRDRREALRELMPDGGVAVLFANPVRNRSNDVDFEYHQDPDLYYLSGLREPDAVLLLFKEPRSINGSSTTELLVVRARDPKREVWDGHRLGSEGAKAVLGLDHTMTGEEFLAMAPPFRSSDKVFLHLADENLRNDPHAAADLADLIDHVEARASGTDLQDPAVLEDMLAHLREVKSPEELALMRKAIDITCEAQMDLMRKLGPDMTEYQTEAIIEYVFKVNGAEHEGFPSIQGGGPHSCVLHYVTNRRTLGDGDLLVSDVGAEYHGYTADVTRTIPANGRFTPDQRRIYELVLAAQEAGIAEVHPGRPFQSAHRAASAVIAKGLVELGIIKEEGEVRRYFMHGTSHYLGLDVHDAGTYGPLRTGSVITVEPGIYIAKDSPCDPRWWGIGVRIEDDILVTEDGPVNLSGSAPRLAEEIEELMRQE
ncbi:MAG: aminopeptidase P N-terminal domain-containing protein [Flavobacteriales bacterium]|nr:aminopeptidase P N-terminal domain-containing protein [Flavobacteriales bacterium]